MKIKIKNILSLLVLAGVVSLNSCYDNKMEWGDPYTHPTPAELPLPLKEAISRYAVLKNYTDFTLGAGIDFNMYQSNTAYRNIINANFTEITAGNEMKQSSLMNSSGVLNFANADAGIEQLKGAGLTVFGHTLVWHSQQQATYLNGLIAPTIIMPPAGSNLLDNGSFEDGMTGWGQWGGGSTNEIVTEGAVDGEKALKINIPNAGDTWSVQLRTPAVPTVIGHQYEVSFFIRSESPGAVRLSIGSSNMMSNRWPQHKNAVPGSKDNILATSSAWQQIVFSTNTIATEDPWVALGESAQFDLDLGQIAGVYYIDNVIIVDLDAEVDGNLLPAGGFESGDLAADGWQTANNPGAGIEITTEQVRTGTYALKLTAKATSANDWDLQLGAPPIPVTSGNQYEISFYIKSDVDGKGRLSFGSSMSNNYPWMNGAREFTTSTEWTRVIYSPATIGSDWAAVASELQIAFDLGLVPDVTYYIDDVTVLDVTAGTNGKSVALRAGPTIIEKTPEEKFDILEPVFIQYITDVASHFAGKVTGWDVVNEPMEESGTVRKGEENMESANVFYWQYYLGTDYAVTAFKTARAADPGAKLFINDYNLDYSLAKCDGIIEYVNYIESKGATVDGIGTQMHLSLDANRDNIAQMFQKLAATGKLIKITELDIKTGTASPTIDQHARQADLYQYVVDAYKQYVPKNQRYGITVWGVSDNADEHVYWLPDESPCLWDADYERKHAYKGFADGLAGKDVSADFSGELIY